MLLLLHQPFALAAQERRDEHVLTKVLYPSHEVFLVERALSQVASIVVMWYEQSSMSQGTPETSQTFPVAWSP